MSDSAHHPTLWSSNKNKKTHIFLLKLWSWRRIIILQKHAGDVRPHHRNNPAQKHHTGTDVGPVAATADPDPRCPSRAGTISPLFWQLFSVISYTVMLTPKRVKPARCYFCLSNTRIHALSVCTCMQRKECSRNRLLELEKISLNQFSLQKEIIPTSNFHNLTASLVGWLMGWSPLELSFALRKWSDVSWLRIK